MKKNVVLLSVVSVLLLCLAMSAHAKTFGKGITLKEETKISAILENPEEFHTKRVLVRGIVVDVCAKRGCWIELAGDKGSDTIRVKVLDGEIVFPMEIKGHEALVEGVIYRLVFDEKGQLIENTSDQPESSETHQNADADERQKGKLKIKACEGGTDVVYQIRGIGAEME